MVSNGHAHVSRVSGRLPRTVVVLGVVSLLSDVSSEMIFPLLPAFLAARLPAAPLLLGATEGLADLVSAILKYQSGVWADRARRLKPLVLLGYSVSGLARPLMAFVTAGWHPLVIRGLDRVGKGVRTSPRDAIIAHTVPAAARGRAFGLYNGLTGGASLAAGLLFGAVWTQWGSSVAFITAGGLAGLSALLLAVFLPRARAR